MTTVVVELEQIEQGSMARLSSIDGSGLRCIVLTRDLGIRGGTSKCLWLPSRRSACAFRHTAERDRFRRAAICLAEWIGHSLIRVVVSVSVQSDMAGPSARRAPAPSPCPPIAARF